MRNFTKIGCGAASGTHLQGYVTAKYNDLVRVFGEPELSGYGGKTQAEWTLRFTDGTIATLYDWKENCDPVDVTRWHIGGFNSRAVDLVHDALFMESVAIG